MARLLWAPARQIAPAKFATDDNLWDLATETLYEITMKEVSRIGGGVGNILDSTPFAADRLAVQRQRQFQSKSIRDERIAELAGTGHA